MGKLTRIVLAVFIQWHSKNLCKSLKIVDKHFSLPNSIKTPIKRKLEKIPEKNFENVNSYNAYKFWKVWGIFFFIYTCELFKVLHSITKCYKKVKKIKSFFLQCLCNSHSKMYAKPANYRIKLIFISCVNFPRSKNGNEKKTWALTYIVYPGIFQKSRHSKFQEDPTILRRRKGGEPESGENLLLLVRSGLNFGHIRSPIINVLIKFLTRSLL